MNEKRIEKAFDTLDAQARRFDEVEADISAIKSYIDRLDEKSDRMITMLGELLKSQMQARDNIETLQERQNAGVELFLGLSQRVDRIEEMLTPTPQGAGNGRG